MLCYLMRHGDSLSAAVDPRRPLSPGGRKGVEEIAQLALARAVRVAAIRHSGILRAKETAEIIGRYLAPLKGVRAQAGLIPDDDPAIVRAELETFDEPILLVGHLPHINRLTSMLVTGDPERRVIDFVPAALACCAKREDNWEIAWTISPASR